MYIIIFIYISLEYFSCSSVTTADVLVFLLTLILQWHYSSLLVINGWR